MFMLKEVLFVATSSITKNFVISGKEQVEMFVNAIEESAQNRPVHIPVSVKEIKGEKELREMMRLRKLKMEGKCRKRINFFRSISVSIWH